MGERSDIEILFSRPEGAVKARKIAETMTYVYVRNGFEYLPFDGMRKVNADGWIHYPERYVRYEKTSSFRLLWQDYRRIYRYLIRSEDADALRTEAAVKKAGTIYTNHCRLIISDRCGIGDNRQIDHQYFQDFFSMLCFLAAEVCSDLAFEGLFRSFDPESYTKRILTHAVYDKSALVFEQMEGDPVYAANLISWTRSEDRLIKHSLRLPFIRVDIITKDRDVLKQDEELGDWIRAVNESAEAFPLAVADNDRLCDSVDADIPLSQMEAEKPERPGMGAQIGMVSAELCFRHASDPYVMLRAASRQLCVKYRDALTALLSGKGYQTAFFSILYAGECTGSKIQVPDSVTAIGDDAFRRRTDLKSIVIPDSVTQIGEDAFQECISLSEISVPDSVAEIGSFAFSSCTGLTCARLPDGLKKLEFGLFSGCRSLKWVKLPAGVREIEGCVFSRCSSLKCIEIPGKARKIGEQAFKDCTSLERILLPKSVVEIGKDIFMGCSPDLVICGERKSAAQRYAQENGIQFAEME